MKTSKNCMGTTTFEYKFSGMKKVQEFDVYPIDKNSSTKTITIQSSTRIGKIDLETGKVSMSKSRSSGAYFVHLSMDKLSESFLPVDDLLTLKTAIIGTADELAGNNGLIYCDNSKADSI